MHEGKETGNYGSKAYWRHVKRYVQAPSHRFAVIAQPSLIPLCKEELIGLGIKEPRETEAGVEFEGKLSACYLSNLWLRTAGRILCRLESFRAGINEELFHKVYATPWELWLDAGIPLDVKAYVERSRIQHEGIVAETVYQAMARRFREYGEASPSRWRSQTEGAVDDPDRDEALSPHRQRVLVHLHENHCRISLDSSGALLHRRGYRKQHTGAPLRETLAAAILMKSGWKGDIPLVDGMCGAGTFAIEAALAARRIAPGLRRPFMFERWPGVETKTWDYLRRMAGEKAIDRCPAGIVAIDRAQEAIEAARCNSGNAGVCEDIRWERMDFFRFEPKQHNLQPGLLVLNPPYGKRLESEGAELYRNLGAHIRRTFQGWRFAIMAPDRSLAIGLKLGSMRLWNVTHGGLPIVVALGKA